MDFYFGCVFRSLEKCKQIFKFPASTFCSAKVRQVTNLSETDEEPRKLFLVEEKRFWNLDSFLIEVWIGQGKFIFHGQIQKIHFFTGLSSISKTSPTFPTDVLSASVQNMTFG